MKNSLVGKGLVLVIMLLFIGASIIPSTVGINEEEHNLTNNNNSFIAKGVKDTTTVSINPPSQTVSPGETFTVDVFCVPSQQIKSFELKLSFDPLLLQANSVTEGDIFDGYTTFFNPGTIDNNAGNIVDIYGLILGSGNVSNPGTLVNISLTAKSTIGSSLLNLYDVGVTNETEYVSITVNDGKVGEEYVYTSSTTDPDGDQVYYKWYWGDETSDWIGPYDSGDTAAASHVWDEKGDYNIKVKAKDVHGEESPWSDPLAISMPRNKAINPFILFLERLIERFPILEQILLSIYYKLT